MRALSIIGIIMSVLGLIVSLYVMTEAKANCYCNEDYLYSSGSVPDEAVGGSLMMMIMFIFFLVFSIVSATKNFGKDNLANSQTIPPFQANPFQQANPYQQPFQQPYQQQYPPNPYQQPNPFQQNPYQQNPPQNPNPPQTPPANPWEPPRQ
ncbi:MAG TPA: hypothetical protein VFJ43_07855 [Bacteroidia bacterium]|nr:hypothetical protein [Bacteroidia bacterium]